MKTWRLKKEGERRSRLGHPWIFASEVSHSVKEVEPGELVELHDSSDHFVGYGYAHPRSQIAFRRLSLNRKETDVLSAEFFYRRLLAAREHRAAAGWTKFSHRWLYAEGDGVPGLIVDAFLRVDGGWVVVAQSSTAGMDRCREAWLEAIGRFDLGGEVSIVWATNSKSRALEGLSVGGKELLVGPKVDLNACELRFSGDVRLKVDLLNGQKTGFFLDQQWNIELLKRFELGRPLKILDVCCYVGQWASHLARGADVVLFDASSEALKLAAANAELNGARSVEAVQGDALKDLESLPLDTFDVVVCDPPAFVKKKADLESGMRAYVKLNREGLRRVRPGGLYVAASCSGLVRGEEWRRVLIEASSKAGRSFRGLVAGGHGPDHPERPEFPEGSYLKCVFGRVEPR